MKSRYLKKWKCRHRYISKKYPILCFFVFKKNVEHDWNMAPIWLKRARQGSDGLSYFWICFQYYYFNFMIFKIKDKRFRYIKTQFFFSSQDINKNILLPSFSSMTILFRQVLDFFRWGSLFFFWQAFTNFAKTKFSYLQCVNSTLTSTF